MSKCTVDCLSRLIDLVAVLRIRHERDADSLDGLETETAGLVQARIMEEFVDEGNRGEPDAYDTAKILAKIIDEYTPL
jgi:hypothetical protein